MSSVASLRAVRPLAIALALVACGASKEGAPVRVPPPKSADRKVAADRKPPANAETPAKADRRSVATRKR